MLGGTGVALAATGKTGTERDRPGAPARAAIRADRDAFLERRRQARRRRPGQAPRRHQGPARHRGPGLHRAALFGGLQAAADYLDLKPRELFTPAAHQDARADRDRSGQVCRRPQAGAARRGEDRARPRAHQRPDHAEAAGRRAREARREPRRHRQRPQPEDDRAGQGARDRPRRSSPTPSATPSSPRSTRRWPTRRSRRPRPTASRSASAPARPGSSVSGSACAAVRGRARVAPVRASRRAWRLRRARQEGWERAPAQRRHPGRSGTAVPAGGCVQLADPLRRPRGPILCGGPRNGGWVGQRVRLCRRARPAGQGVGTLQSGGGATECRYAALDCLTPAEAVPERGA